MGHRGQHVVEQLLGQSDEIVAAQVEERQPVQRRERVVGQHSQVVVRQIQVHQVR